MTSKTGDGAGIGDVRAKLEFDLFFVRRTGSPASLENQAEIGDIKITVDSASGFEIGCYLGIFSSVANRYFFSDVIDIDGNDITFNTPLDFAFVHGDNVQPLSNKMNVDGSTEDKIFEIRGGGPNSTLVVNITGIRLCFNATNFDPGNFGSLPALTNGIFFRRIDGITKNIFTLKNNFDMSTTGKINFIEDGGNRKTVVVDYIFDQHGTSIQLLPGSKIEIAVRDDLTGLDFCRALAFGYEVKQ